MPFPLELYLGIENDLDWVLFSISRRLYLEGTTERCSLKYVFFKTLESRHTEVRCEHIVMIEKINTHHLSDIKLLLIACIKNVLSS